MEFNQCPFTSEAVGRGTLDKKLKSDPKVPFRVVQRVWIKVQNHPTGTAVKDKYKKSDIVEKVLDTVLLKNRGIQQDEHLKPFPN